MGRPGGQPAASRITSSEGPTSGAGCRPLLVRRLACWVAWRTLPSPFGWDSVSPVSGLSVVLGAASGIGRAIAQAFIQEGAQVALIDRSASVAEVAQQMRGAQTGQTLAVVADVTDYGAMQRAAAQIEQTLGTDKYPRLRFGIGNNYPKGMQADFVLGKWLNTELPTVQLKIEKCINIIENFVSMGIEQTMSEVNRLSIQA